MEFISPLANPAQFWPGLILAVFGGVLIGRKQIKTTGTIMGYLLLAGGSLLMLRAAYDVPSYVTDAIVLIILLVAAFTLIFANDTKWYVKLIGVVLLIVFYIRLKTVAPPGTLIGDMVAGIESAVAGLGALISGG